MSAEQQLSVYYPDLSRGWGPTAPPRTLTPESPRIWRDVINMWAIDGLLRRRPAAVSAGFAAQPAEGVTTSSASTHDGELPVFIHTDLYPSGATRTTVTGSCANEYDYDGGAELIVLVTNRQAYITNDGGTTWRNVTPTYTTGTVTATNGLVSVTGAGTAWSARGISPFQFIILDNTVYQICTVTSDTTLTLTTPYQGVTGAGKAYTIRRTWRGGYTLDRSSLIFCKVYNQNLYIAGTFIGRADGETRPTVIRVENILSSTPTTTYLTSTVDLTGTLDVITSPTLTDITGLQILQDSRLVLSGSDSTLYYSSNLDQAVWSVSPAGFVVDTQVDGPIHALGMIGNVLTAHHQDGITLCYPQAQTNQPLALQRSQSAVGCFAPRSLCAASGVERFVAVDGQVYQFDLSVSTAIGDDLRGQQLNQLTPLQIREAVHGVYHPYRDEYFVVYEEYPNSYIYVLQARQGLWWRWFTPYPVTAISGRNCTTSRGASSCFIGVPNLDYNEQVPFSSPTEVDLLWSWREGSPTDTITYFDSSIGGSVVTARTDRLDVGQPLMAKAVQRVIVWLMGVEDGTEDLSVSISYDGFDTLFQTVNRSGLTVDINHEIPYQFCFDYEGFGTGPSTAPQIRIQGADENTFRAIPTQLLVIMEAAGNIEDISL